jgi:hypothetical protein
MADLVGNFLKGLERLVEGEENALGAGVLVEKIIVKKDNEVQKRFSTSVNYGYSLMMANKGEFDSRKQVFAAALFSAKYFADKEQEEEIKKLVKQLPADYSRPVIMVRQNFDYIKRNVNQGTQAAYNKSTNELVVRALGAGYWQPVKKKVGGIPSILVPLYILMKEKSTGDLESNLIHEATHAYINQSTSCDTEVEDLREIDEGAATAVSMILPGSHSFNQKGREESGLNSEKVLKYAEAFKDSVKDLPTDGRVEKIRENGAKAIKLARKGNSPEEAVSSVTKEQ